VDRERLITLLAILVGLVWALMAVGSLVERDYTALTITTPVMLVVTGFLFGVKRNGGDR
jgi:hypothetical protein